MEKYKLEKNILNFIDKCAKEVGKFEEDNFNQTLWCACLEKGMESPIEQILYCALKTIARLNFINEAEPVEYDGKTYVLGLGIWPQYVIGNYRVDFLVEMSGIDYKNRIQTKKGIIIECDSQQFHERTEEERRYEKKRDRYLMSKGYKIFHYTGKEILVNPLKIACEIIAFVTDSKIEDFSMEG